MITILLALTIVLTLAFVVYPMFQPITELDVALVGVTDSTWENLVVQRDAAYSTIKDLTSDHALGKLSDEDYRALRAKYEMKAVAILQQLDSVQAVKPETRKPNTTDEDIERKVSRLRRPSQSGAWHCPTCGTRHQTGDRFCAKCGGSLTGVHCPSCGTRTETGDKFCGRCGTAIQ